MAKFEYTYLSVDHNKDVMDNHIEMLNAWGIKDGNLSLSFILLKKGFTVIIL